MSVPPSTPPGLVSLLSPADADDPDLVAEITDLVNRVYAGDEVGLWVDGATRTTQAEIASWIRSEQIAIARVDRQLVGTIRIQQLETGDGDFGLLTAAPGHRGVGIGRALVEFAERRSWERGASRMQLELLVPRTWMHPFKEFLRAWYTRIGYRIVRVTTLDETYPALMPQLATACDLVVFRKDLRAGLDAADR